MGRSRMHNSRGQDEPRRLVSAARITVIYLVIGALWILLSDQLLAALSDDPVLLTRLGTAKGWFYVTATAGLLYLLIRHSDVALERRVEERTQQLVTLLKTTQDVASSLDLDRVLEAILEELNAVVAYSGAGVLTLDEGDLVTRAYRGPGPLDRALGMQFAAGHAHHRQVIATQRPVIISDTRSDDPLAHAFRELSGELLEPHYGYVRSWLGAPLMTKGQVTGMLILHHTEPNYYAGVDPDLVMAFANQAAVAIENAQLFGQARQRLSEIQSLQRVTTGLLQKLTLEEMLEIVCREACELTGADGGALFSLQEGAWLDVIQSRGSLEPFTTRMAVEDLFTGDAILSGEPLLVNDPDRLARSRHLVPDIESLLVIPLRQRDAVVGALDVVNKPGGFTQDDVRVLSLFADVAALAIERAWLEQQAEQLAVVEERHRLSRELHDSVTQALYSVTLYAEATRMAMEAGKPEVAAENLRELHSMAREAMLDMRMLIFELHPPVLEQEGLVAALHARLAAVETRAGLETQLHAEGERCLPLSVEDELFRIALEAFNNVVKHARARQVTVRLRYGQESVELEVSDDGRGFDPTAARHSGGVGLRGIQERVQQIDGVLEIESAPGEGTTLRVTVSI